MACRGVHFALDEAAVARLKAFSTDEERREDVTEEIEESYFNEHRDWVGESDKAWDALHRALTDGKLEWENGTYPLNHTILGGELLYEGDDYIMSLKSPDQVRDVAEALAMVDEQQLRSGYFAIDEADYDGPFNEEDFQYTWSNFTDLRTFYVHAAELGRYVLFTVDL